MTRVSPTLEPVYEIFGSRLRACRLRKGLTLRELGEMVTPPRTVAAMGHIEQGQQRIPLHVAAELAAAVGADLGAMIRPSHKRAKWEALGE